MDLESHPIFQEKLSYFMLFRVKVLYPLRVVFGHEFEALLVLQASIQELKVRLELRFLFTRRCFQIAWFPNLIMSIVIWHQFIMLFKKVDSISLFGILSNVFEFGFWVKLAVYQFHIYRHNGLRHLFHSKLLINIKTFQS